MRFSAAVDAYVTDMNSQGRINSLHTERSYRFALGCLADEVSNRDPRAVNRTDVKRALTRWTHPTTRGKNLAVLRAFFDWCMEEGLRKDNPARQVRRPRRRPPAVYRLTRTEVADLLQAARGIRERRCIFFGICAGLRVAELRGLQGRHLRRPGWVWVSADIAKGKRERWVPVVPDLEPVWQEAAATLADDEFLLPAQRFRDPGINRRLADKARFPSAPQTLWRLVKEIGKRAEIPADVYPHMMRHAFADHVARGAGVRAAQSALGHAGIATTEMYLGKPTLDELAAAFRGLGSSLTAERPFSPPSQRPAMALVAPGGIEPPISGSRVVERFAELLGAHLAFFRGRAT